MMYTLSVFYMIYTTHLDPSNHLDFCEFPWFVRDDIPDIWLENSNVGYNFDLSGAQKKIYVASIRYILPAFQTYTVITSYFHSTSSLFDSVKFV
ncbi:unnamed protein product [Phytomonas sp. Hart1]|nr:unnamed protein product [Phytomonas sp. Hart1]|eukprot:CCW72147.1 unnamed protein product [Phytomonas sp. isolate Hart1]